jgi:glycine dehydrogenase subunit 1
MKFIPNSKLKNEMLKDIELNEIDELFSDITSEIKISELNLPPGLSQQETEEKLKKISEKNESYHDFLNFIGGGIKPHYIPAVVKSIISRAEFFTSYTPYQSEASQGFLQAMFEYQSLIAEITGMDIANCSLYDGVTALSEAALMCSRLNGKKTFVVPNNISWEKKSVLRNYAQGPGIKIREISYDEKSGRINLSDLKKSIDDKVSGVYVENPNFFGVFEDDMSEISKIVKKNNALLVVGVDPVSLGVIKSPDEYGADIVIGEGRALGNHMDFGGSTLGIFACKKDFLRQMPGRIIGLTKDIKGKRAFCMTLQTREQHIRRGRATSNICTNEGLNALAATVYMSWLGSDGLEKLSKINFENAKKLAEKITSLNGFDLRFDGSFFNEFVIKSKADPIKINKRLMQKKIFGGLPLEEFYPELANCMICGITEAHTEDDIDIFVKSLKEVANV